MRTETFTYNAGDWGSESYIAMQQFQDTHELRNQFPIYPCTSLNMDTARVWLADEHIIKTDIQHDADFKTNRIATRIYTLAPRYVVIAENEYGTTFIAKKRGYHTGYSFETEAEAIKAMKFMIKADAKFHYEQALCAGNAHKARRALDVDPMKAPTGAEIHPDDAIGAYVRIHQMGKFRVGVIVDQTPTKWIAVYTTPSNDTEIRLTKVNKGA